VVRPIRALLTSGAGPTRYVPVYDNVIHNYFPDGNIHSDALIDTENAQDFVDFVWYGNSGTETLSRSTAAENSSFMGIGTPFDMVKIECPGDDFNEGVAFNDWGRQHGGLASAGHVQVGFTLFCAPLIPLYVELNFRDADGNSVFVESQNFVNVIPYVPTRVSLNAYLPVDAYVGAFVTTTNRLILNGAIPSSPVEMSLYVGHVMVTEGDPAKFMDGDSEGWEWLGDPYASPSRGPQP